jgi:hypothetical protein
MTLIPGSMYTSEQAQMPDIQKAGWLVRSWQKSASWHWPLFLLLIVVVVIEAAWVVDRAATDAVRYQCYGLTFWLGSSGRALLPSAQCAFMNPPYPTGLPFHLLPQEYPPLTILLFSLPLLAPLPYYTLVFALLMTGVAGLICWLLVRVGTWKAAPIFLLYLLLGTATLFQVRFDLLPAGCTLLCVITAERGRWKTAYFTLALGVLLKLYPIVMLPALFLAEQQAWLASQGYTSGQRGWLAQLWAQIRLWRWSNALLCLGLVVVIMGAFALLNFNQAIINPLQYFVQRPVQIESLGSSIIWLGSLFGVTYTPVFTYGSFNVVSPLGGIISPTGTLLLLAGVIALLWLQWSKKIDFAQAMVALVCVIMTTGKVFSPQYLIWLTPMLAYLYASGKTNRLWMYGWAAISVLTTVIYIYYSQIGTNPKEAPFILASLPGFFEVVTVRNLLLLVATLAFLCGWWGTRRSRDTKSIKIL